MRLERSTVLSSNSATGVLDASSDWQVDVLLYWSLAGGRVTGVYRGEVT